MRGARAAVRAPVKAGNGAHTVRQIKSNNLNEEFRGVCLWMLSGQAVLGAPDFHPEFSLAVWLSWAGTALVSAHLCCHCCFVSEPHSGVKLRDRPGVAPRIAALWFVPYMYYRSEACRVCLLRTSTSVLEVLHCS